MAGATAATQGATPAEWPGQGTMGEAGSSSHWAYPGDAAPNLCGKRLGGRLYVVKLDVAKAFDSISQLHCVLCVVCWLCVVCCVLCGVCCVCVYCVYRVYCVCFVCHVFCLSVLCVACCVCEEVRGGGGNERRREGGGRAWRYDKS